MSTMSSKWTEKIVLDIDKGIAAGHANPNFSFSFDFELRVRSSPPFW